MNKTYKTKFNRATGTVCAISEISSSHSKNVKAVVVTIASTLALASTLWLGQTSTALAAPPTSLTVQNGNVNTVIRPSHISFSNGTGTRDFRLVVTNIGSTGFGDSRTFNNLGAYATSFGIGSVGSGRHSVALGVDSKASGDKAIGIGNNSKGNKAGAVAIGNEAQVYGDWALALGSGAITRNNLGVAIGPSALVETVGGIAIGNNAKAQYGGKATAIGMESFAGSDGTALGGNASAKLQSVAVGIGAQTNNYSVSVGKSANAGLNAVAVGHNARATGNNAIGLGKDVNVTGNNTLALGSELAAGLANSIYLGNNSVGTPGLTPQSAGTTVYNTLADHGFNYQFAGGSPVGLMTIGRVGQERRIQNVAAGRINETSTDAINGSQLFALTRGITLKSADNPTGIRLMSQSNLTAQAGKNIDIALTGDAQNAALSIKTKDDVEFTTVKLPHDVTLTGTEAGLTLNNKKITGIANGTAPGEAANYDQVKALHDNVARALGLEPGEALEGLTPDFTVGDQHVSTLKDAIGQLNQAVTGQTLRVAGDASTNASINLKEQTLAIHGQPGLLTTSAQNDAINIALAESVVEKLNHLPSNALETFAQKDLSNLDTAGAQKLAEAAQNAFQITSDTDALTVSSENAEHVRTYKLNLKQTANVDDLSNANHLVTAQGVKDYVNEKIASDLTSPENDDKLVKASSLKDYVDSQLGDFVNQSAADRIDASANQDKLVKAGQVVEYLNDNKATGLDKEANADKLTTASQVVDYLEGSKAQGIDTASNREKLATAGQVVEYLNDNKASNLDKGANADKLATASQVIDYLETNKANGIDNEANRDKLATAGQMVDYLQRQTANNINAPEDANKLVNATTLKSFVEGSLSQQTLAYRVDGDSAPQTTSLSQGLTFKGDKNLAIRADSHGVVNFAFKPDFTGLSSLSGEGHTLSFTPEGLNANNAKLTGLADAANATDAVNLAQMTRSLEANKAELQSLMDDQSRTLTAQGEKIRANEQQLTTQNETLQNHGTQIQDLSDKVNQQAGTLENHNERLTTQGAKIEENTASLQRQGETLARHEESLNTNTRRIGEVEQLAQGKLTEFDLLVNNEKKTTINNEHNSLKVVAGEAIDLAFEDGALKISSANTFKKATIENADSLANPTGSSGSRPGTTNYVAPDSQHIVNGRDVYRAIHDTRLDISGDYGERISLAPNSLLSIEGGAADLTDGNIGVQTPGSDSRVFVKLASRLNGLESAAFGDTLVDRTGFHQGDVHLTATGLNNGGQKIQNLGEGTLSATSHDALTGQQLFSTNQAIASALGTELTPEGSIVAPNYEIQGQRVNSIKAALGALNEAQNTQAGRLSEQAQSIQTNQEAIAQHQSRLEDQGRSIEENRRQIASHEESLQRQSARLDANEQLSAQNAQKLNNQANLIAQNQSALANNASAIEANQGLIRQNANALERHDQTLNAQGTQIEANKMAIDQHNEAIAANQAAIQRHGEAIAANQAQIAENRQSLSNLSDRVTQNDQRLENHAEHLASLDSKTDTLRDSMKDMQSKFDRGMSFKGDRGLVNKKLNETLNIQGGAEDLTNNNIGVDIDESGTIQVKLASAVSGLTSLEVGGHTLDDSGMTLNDEGRLTAGGVTLSAQGLNNGGNTLKGIGSGFAPIAKEKLDAGEPTTISAIYQEVVSSPQSLAKVTNNAVNVGDLVKVIDSVFGSENSQGQNTTQFVHAQSVVSDPSRVQNSQVTDESMLVADANGQPLLTTYNVQNQSEILVNSTATAIHNMNKNGIRFFHTNDGTHKPLKEESFNTVDSSAAGRYSTAIGYNTHVTQAADNAIAIGSNSIVSGANSLSLGQGNIVKGRNAGAIGDPSTINADSSFAVGNDNRIGGMSDGDRAEKTTDVFALGNRVEVLEGATGGVALGSDTLVKEKNSVALGKKSQAKTSTKALQNAEVYQPENNRPVQGQGQEVMGEVALGYDDEATQTTHTRRITYVAAGAKDTDAVNVSQVRALDRKVMRHMEGVNRQFSAINERMNQVDRRARSGIAGATALAMLPQPTSPGKSALAASFGNYRGSTALAIGFSHITENNRVIMKAGVSANTDDNYNVGAGVALQW